jgi:hypothetical protein
MLLVPRQLQRSGMTGAVPYYGGRFSPAQAYAASHPRATSGPAPGAPPRTAQPVAAPAAPSQESLAALRRLLDEGVLTQEEYAEIAGRVST